MTHLKVLICYHKIETKEHSSLVFLLEGGAGWQN